MHKNKSRKTDSAKARVDFLHPFSRIAKCNTKSYTNLGIKDIPLEWDEAKNKGNIRKHGIDFEDAKNVFFDADRLEIFDTEHSEYEDRYITIGYIGEIIVVVYTIRIIENNRETIRLISSRRATASERNAYYGKNTNI